MYLLLIFTVTSFHIFVPFLNFTIFLCTYVLTTFESVESLLHALAPGFLTTTPSELVCFLSAFSTWDALIYPFCHLPSTFTVASYQFLVKVLYIKTVPLSYDFSLLELVAAFL